METVAAIIRLNKSSVRDHSFSRKIESERSFFWLGELAQVEPRSAQKNPGGCLIKEIRMEKGDELTLG